MSAKTRKPAPKARPAGARQAPIPEPGASPEDEAAEIVLLVEDLAESIELAEPATLEALGRRLMAIRATCGEAPAPKAPPVGARSPEPGALSRPWREHDLELVEGAIALVDAFVEVEGWAPAQSVADGSRSGDEPRDDDDLFDEGLQDGDDDLDEEEDEDLF